MLAIAFIAALIGIAVCLKRIFGPDRPYDPNIDEED